MRHRIPAFVIVILSGLFAGTVQAGFTGVYFFGDSLTDTGNVQDTYAAINPKPPGFPAAIPGAPYDPQGRFTNGPNYADVLAARLGFDATASTRGGNNYAYGGAQTRYQNLGPPFLGILDQVNSYVAQPGGADPTALYVLWGGANNLQDILAGLTVDVLGNPIPDVAGTIGDLRTAILDLYGDGVRHILIPNVPDLGQVPRVRALGAQAEQAASQLTQAFNFGLAGMLATLEADIGNLDLLQFDVFSAFNQLLANPSAYGFSNATDPCYTGDDITFSGGGSVCANPDQYVFWDGIHPTAAAHRILGNLMFDGVAPEPAEWVLVLTLGLLGFVLLGRARRR